MDKSTWFSEVERAIPDQDGVAGVERDGRPEEMNKRLSPNEVGGCFCQTFLVTLENENPLPHESASRAAYIENGLQNDISPPLGEHTLLSVSESSTGSSHPIEVKAYFIPDPV